MYVLITKVDYAWHDSSHLFPPTLFIHAQGHATDVVAKAREIAQTVLSGHAWRFVLLAGHMPENSKLDSDMEWKIIAEVKQ